jgi:hypothetical protein
MPVNIHGKQYLPVAERMEMIKTEIGIANYSVQSEVLHHDSERVIVRVELHIDHGNGIQRYVGHAEEYRAASKINKTSALENAETSALGRALAFAGWAGDEIASADEVAAAIQQQQPTQQQQPQQQPQSQPQQQQTNGSGGKTSYAGSEVNFDVYGEAKKKDQQATYAVLDEIAKKGNLDKGLKAKGELAEECNLMLAEIVQGTAGNPNDDGLPF